MDCEVKTYMKGQAKRDLWRCNVKTLKYMPMAAKGQFLVPFGTKSNSIVWH